MVPTSMSQNLAMANVPTEQNRVELHLPSASLDTCRTNTLNVMTPANIIPIPAMENVLEIPLYVELIYVSLLLKNIASGTVEMNAYIRIIPVMELVILTEHHVELKDVSTIYQYFTTGAVETIAL